MSNPIQLQYDVTAGDTWATGFIGTAAKKFEFACSYLSNNPFEELLNAVYQIVPNLATFPRKQIQFTLWDEPIEYSWEFQVRDEQNVALQIYEKGYDKKSALIFEETYKIYDLIKALVQCMKRNPYLLSTDKIERIHDEFTLYVKNNVGGISADDASI